jgi:c-di-GMP-binding flagellar brake protein YcgR
MKIKESDRTETNLDGKAYAVAEIVEETRPRTAIVNFEKRSHPRFNVDLPIEYYGIDSSIGHGRAINASEGGLLIYFPERMEIGQHLKLKLFFASGSDLNTIEALVEVVWRDIHLGQARGDYRSGVRFIGISPEDTTKLKIFLRSLSHPRE